MWKESKARNIGDGCKYSRTELMGKRWHRNGGEEGAGSVLEVKRVSDSLMAIKLEVKGWTLNIVSVYAPQVNNSMEEKNDFLENRLIESVSKQTRCRPKWTCGRRKHRR